MKYTEEVHAKRLKECILKGLTDFCPPARDFSPNNSIGELWEDCDPCEVCLAFVKGKEHYLYGGCPCNRLKNPIEDSRQVLIERGYMSDHKLEDFKVGDLVQVLDKSIGSNQTDRRNKKGNLLYVVVVHEDRLSCWPTKDIGHGDHFLPSDLLIIEQEKEWIKLEKTYEEKETMESKFKVVKPFTPYDVIQKHKEVFGWGKLQDACDEFLEDLDTMIEAAGGDVYGTIEDLDYLELEDRDEMRKYFLKWGLIEEVKDPKHDWSGLEIKPHPYDPDIICVYDPNSDKYLLGFEPDGKVTKYIDAEGGAGKFDSLGKLIIE